MVILSTSPEVRVCDEYNITLHNVQEFIDGGVLQPVHGISESFMIYGQFNGHGKVQIGIFAALDVDDCLANCIRRHEQVTTSADRSLEKPASATPFTVRISDTISFNRS